MLTNTTRSASMITLLTISLLSTVVIVSAGAISVFTVQAVQQARRDLEQKADEALAYLTDVLTIAVWDFDKTTVKLIGNTFLQDHQLVQLRVTAFPNILLYQAEKSSAPDLISRTGAIRYQGEQVGEVQLAFSKAGYQANIRRMLMLSGVALILVLATIGLATNALIRIFLKRPLTQFTEIVQAYAAGRYEASSLITIHYREFLPFGNVLHQMGQKIMRQVEELQNLNAELEERVQQRTVELSTANQALSHARERAETANQAKSTFLANMSHELRTPLTAILGFTQVLRRDPVVRATQGEALTIIQQSGEYLLTLINDVLEMSKIEAGQLTIDVHPVDLDVLLTSLETMLRRRAADKGVAFEIVRAPNVPRHIHADERKLRQILLNLLSNAIKFTMAGSIMLNISAAEDGEHASLNMKTVQFEIIDTGCGIAPKDLNRIFEPFARAATSQQTAIEGTGLGLPISRQFAELMGGAIHVASEPGRGSVFTLTIPVECTEPGIPVAQTLPRQVIGLEPDQPRYRILVVDDQPDTRHLLSTLLRLVGFDVREAHDGQAALAHYQVWQPHLIWMDQRMPGMTGEDATRAIRAAELRQRQETRESHEFPPPVKIIALTANIFQEEQARLLAGGCDDFVRKPFTETKIFEMMAQHLGVRYVYEELPSLTGQEPGNAPLPPLSPADLAGLPTDWLATLRHAARRGQDAQVLALITQIEPDHTELAQALRTLAQQFRFDLLVELTASASGE